MPLPLTGSAAVENDDDTLEWTGAPLTPLNCVAGAAIMLDGLGYFVGERIDTNHLRLTRAYAGTTGSAAAEITQLSPEQVATATLNKRAAEVMSQLSVLDANGRGLFYKLIGVTGDNDPGPGNIALDAAGAGVSEVYIDVLDANDGGRDVSGVIGLWGAGTVLILRSLASNAYIALSLTEAPIGSGGYRKLAVERVGSDGELAAEPLAVEWRIKGDRGEAYATDATVDDMDGLTAYDSEDDGFRVFVLDLGAGQDNRSGVVVKTASAWDVVAIYTGPKGSKGNKGNRGWSPMFAGVADGERRVEVLIGYVGGEGTPPTDHVGEYRKGDGTYTTNIAEAVDYRGPPGRDGAGTVAGLVEGEGIAIDVTDPTRPEVSVAAFTGDSGAGGAVGGVPAPAAGDAADGKVLGAGGGWVKPATVPRGHIYGLTLSNNATDATNDIDIAPGEAASDDTTPVLMALASSLTKRLDATWAVGDGDGGRDAGSIADGVWYVWLIQRSDTGVIDALFSLSKTAPTMPSGYDRKRRIGCIIRASAAIKAFKQTGDRFDLTPAIPDGVSVPISTTQQSLNVSLPPEMIGLFRVRLSPAAGAGINLIISGVSISANANEASLAGNSTAGAVAGEFAVPVTGSGQILHRCAGTVGASNMVLTSYGWIDDRGRNV